MCTNSTIVVANHLEKSMYDDACYRVVMLSNDLEVCLRHDPNAKEEGFALIVETGSIQDAPDMIGQAHLYEHLILQHIRDFNKTWFSQANSWKDRTRYLITSPCDTDLSLILKQLGCCLRNPPISIPKMIQEIASIEMEFQGHRNEDSWRVGELRDLAINKMHPAHKFEVGNGKSLGALGLGVRAKININSSACPILVESIIRLTL